MFGFRSAVPSRAHRSLLAAENALAAQSIGHPDGWGIGWFVDDDAYVLKTAKAAHACERFQRTCERLASHTFVVHVRRATVGEIDPVNAHPFRFGRWLFAHNGTIFGFDELRRTLDPEIPPHLASQILGDTDSERLFFWLLARFEEQGLDPTGRRPSSAEGAAAIVRASLLTLDQRALGLGLERPLVNVLLTDGRVMIGHRAGMPLHLSTQKLVCADAPTCPAVKVCLERTRPAGQPVNHLLLASEPIGQNENHWEVVPDGATIVLDASFQLNVTPPPEAWVAPVLPERLLAAAAPCPSLNVEPPC